MTIHVPFNEKHFYILVGAPGSGKSTWIKENAGEDMRILSTDDAIEVIAKAQGLTYSDVWSDNIKLATKAMNELFTEYVKDGMNIILDQTNMAVKKRTSVLQRVPKTYKKFAVVFDVPLEELQRRIICRNALTGKNIPNGVLLNMLNTYEKPTLSEGFDEIIEIKGNIYV